MLRLVAYAPDGVRRFPVHRNELIIGSWPECDIYLPYSGVAQKHARLLYDGSELRIEDLGTRKGLLVSGRKVRESALEVLDEIRLGNLMKMLLSTQAVRVHTGPVDEWGENPLNDAPKSTRYEAFAQLVVEYTGYEAAYALVDQSLYDLGWDDLESVSFTQLLDLCDRLSMALNQHCDRKQVNEAARRLRARATSVL